MQGVKSPGSLPPMNKTVHRTGREQRDPKKPGQSMWEMSLKHRITESYYLLEIVLRPCFP